MIGFSVKCYGKFPCRVVIVHGGPGAPGEMGPVAEKLSKSIGVLEPWQSEDTITEQVEELKEQISTFANTPVVLIGWSWGAWLSAIFASKYSEMIAKLIIVGSGPLEENYAKGILETRLSRLKGKKSTEVLRLLNLLKNGVATDKQLTKFGKLMSDADTYDSIGKEKVGGNVNFEIYKRVWKEAEELRKNGRLLEYFNTIKCPIVVVHGDDDPHPFEGVREPLKKIGKNVKYYLIKNCGHKPWNEKAANKKFYKILFSETKTTLS